MNRFRRWLADVFYATGLRIDPRDDDEAVVLGPEVENRRQYPIQSTNNASSTNVDWYYFDGTTTHRGRA